MKNQPEIDALFARFQSLPDDQKSQLVPRLFGTLDAAAITGLSGVDLLQALKQAIGVEESIAAQITKPAPGHPGSKVTIEAATERMHTAKTEALRGYVAANNAGMKVA
jgi:hypothetical protein